MSPRTGRVKGFIGRMSGKGMGNEILLRRDVWEAQARAIAKAIRSGRDDNNLQQAKILAARDDLGKLADRASNMETSLKQDTLRIESGLHLEMARLEIKIADTKSELLRWMFIFWVGQVTATVAIVFSAVKLLK
jgi:hypothetical protein